MTGAGVAASVVDVDNWHEGRVAGSHKDVAVSSFFLHLLPASAAQHRMLRIEAHPSVHCSLVCRPTSASPQYQTPTKPSLGVVVGGFSVSVTTVVVVAGGGDIAVVVASTSEHDGWSPAH